MDADHGSSGKVTYNYRFIFKDGVEKEFNIALDSVTLNLLPTDKKNYPEWTKLNCFRCSHCTLNDQCEYCPIAINMVDVVDYFRNYFSYDIVETIVTAQERKYFRTVSLQHGVSSLIGIYMVTSGCPVMETLKPMVRFHLPFATIEETKYRAISMYLMAQYFLYQHGRQPDWDLKKLAEAYENVRIVNEYFCKRLRMIQGQDASLNAVVLLDIFADSVNFSMDGRMANDLEYLFKGYFESTPGADNAS
jgi:heterodisulfide reductase subunit C